MDAQGRNANPKGAALPQPRRHLRHVLPGDAGVDHAGPVDLGAGVGRPPLDLDHKDPQPGILIALQDVLGCPPGARQTLASGRGQGQHQPRHPLVGIEPRPQLADVIEIGDGQAGRVNPEVMVTVGGRSPPTVDCQVMCSSLAGR
jgi:hypothetical protein